MSLKTLALGTITIQLFELHSKKVVRECSVRSQNGKTRSGRSKSGLYKGIRYRSGSCSAPLQAFIKIKWTFVTPDKKKGRAFKALPFLVHPSAIVRT